MKKYSASHEWVLVEEGLATVGITDQAQKELGDVVYVELPEVGKVVQAGKEAAVLESTKAAADIYSPVSGEIVAVNKVLTEHADKVNASPEEEGWIFRVRLSRVEELDQLMDQVEYEALAE